MATEIIRVELGAEVSPGTWMYSCGGPSLGGRSRQPLLDACRQFKSMGVATDRAVGVFRNGSEEPDITCSVAAGAATTVLEDNRDGIRFGKFKPFDPLRRADAGGA